MQLEVYPAGAVDLRREAEATNGRVVGRKKGVNPPVAGGADYRPSEANGISLIRRFQ
jgi:hypothetical protein